MIKLRMSEDRGIVDRSWLKAKHTFSFGSYQDPEHKHFGPLLVINQDKIAAGSGFPEHPHDNMEIITYIISGEMSHKDSTGAGSTIFPNRIQRMTAGSGIYHSEFNSGNTETELLQIWLIPEEKGLTPSYEEKEFELKPSLNSLQLLASQKQYEESLFINRDINLYRSNLEAGKTINHTSNRKYLWLQNISGRLIINDDYILNPGDAIGLQHEQGLAITAKENSHFLLFDMN